MHISREHNTCNLALHGDRLRFDTNLQAYESAGPIHAIAQSSMTSASLPLVTPAAPHEMPSPTPTRLAGIDGLIAAYLALPLLLFCAWFKPPIAVALLLLCLWGMGKALSGIDFPAGARALRTQLPWLFILALLVLGWVALGGTGHFFYANRDWLVRDAILRDLAVTAWPPSYAADSPYPLVLRAPVGYYLPAALAGAVGGVRVADLALYLWTAIGFFLFTYGVARLFRTRRQRVFALALAIGFSGLDIVGYPLLQHRIPAPGDHLEWWAGFAQYSSQPTLLFWVPNHALPAWLVTVVVLRLWRTAALARIAPLLFTATLLWSPLSAIGVAPFFLAGINWKADLRTTFNLHHAGIFIGIGLLVARYLTMDASSIPGGWQANSWEKLQRFGPEYLAFCLLEFGMVALLLRGLGVRSAPLTVALAVLLALPLYRFGIANDLVMRASIPALLVLALACIEPLSRDRWRYRQWVLATLLALGFLGAVQEPLRAVIQPAWPASEQSLGEVVAPGMAHFDGMLPPHYVARLNLPGLAATLRSPATVPLLKPPAKAHEAIDPRNDTPS